MAITKPTIAEIKARQIADIQAKLGLAEIQEPSYLRSISDAVAGSNYLLYGYIEELSKLSIPVFSTGEILTSWADTFGLTRTAASFAVGNVTFSGTDGVIIPANTNIIGSNNITYKTSTTVTIVAGTASVAVISLTAGIAGNLTSGSSMNLINPITDVNSSVTTTGINGGSDTESDTDLRYRLLQRIQNAPQGGSVVDYERWALAISGISKAWVIPEGGGPGTVYIYCVTNDEDNLTPSAAKILEVQNYIDDVTRRPVTANVTVFAPTVVNIDFEIALNPNTTAVQESVTANLKDLLIRDRYPGGSYLISRIRENVSTAAGESDNNVISPTANINLQTGEIGKLGTITFSTLS